MIDAKYSSIKSWSTEHGMLHKENFPLGLVNNKKQQKTPKASCLQKLHEHRYFLHSIGELRHNLHNLSLNLLTVTPKHWHGGIIMTANMHHSEL